MKCEQVFKFLDKPETLETVSFLLTKWKSKYGGDIGSSILKTDGCCLTTVFDKQQWETFINWHEGQTRFNELINEYQNSGFKSRKELGIKPEGHFHDEEVLNIRQQLINLYLDTQKKKMYKPAIYSDSPDTSE